MSQPSSALALAEDLGVSPADLAPGQGAALLERDVASDATLAPGVRFEGAIVAREPLVVAGIPVAERVWATLSEATLSDAE